METFRGSQCWREWRGAWRQVSRRVWPRNWIAVLEGVARSMAAGFQASVATELDRSVGGSGAEHGGRFPGECGHGTGSQCWREWRGAWRQVSRRVWPRNCDVSADTAAVAFPCYRRAAQPPSHAASGAHHVETLHHPDIPRLFVVRGGIWHQVVAASYRGRRMVQLREAQNAVYSSCRAASLRRHPRTGV
ncbi:uncharacterized protein LOC119437114 isoform X6 [Dermacentor silvarum]|nr:uncharacterized protein LOC119437114 isoform X6 [Dermacentor silvarum]XP_049516257.1 uncharacterized protein LOC119437114 isoform X6 [Dermacentor silvarum]